MPGDRTKSGDPIAEIPEAAGQLRPPPPAFEPSTLAGRLIPIADKLRNLNALYGLAIYRVWLVHIEWTGRKVGEGQERVISRREVLPVPRVRDFNAVRRIPSFAGVIEEGDLVIDRVSARYTEDDLMGRTPDLTDPNARRTTPRNRQFFWEVRENRNSTPPPPIRRFSPPTAAPMLSRGGFAWTVILTKQAVDPSRHGAGVNDPTAE